LKVPAIIAVTDLCSAHEGKRHAEAVLTFII
jgi:hypothetical protein